MEVKGRGKEKERGIELYVFEERGRERDVCVHR